MWVWGSPVQYLYEAWSLVSLWVTVPVSEVLAVTLGAYGNIKWQGVGGSNLLWQNELCPEFTHRRKVRYYRSLSRGLQKVGFREGREKTKRLLGIRRMNHSICVWFCSTKTKAGKTYTKLNPLLQPRLVVQYEF